MILRELNRRRSVLAGGSTPLPPTYSISITSPTEGQSFASGDDIAITCAIEGTPSRVEYYNGAVLIGTRSVAPFDSFTWSGIDTPDDSTASLSAKLFVADVEEAISSVVGITINAPVPVGVDPDYQAVLDFATANSIPLPTQATQDTQNGYLAQMKAEGVWTQLDSFGMFEGDADISFKLIDWKRLVKMDAFGSLVWSSSGAKGNASNAYIETYYNILNDTVNVTTTDASLGVKVYDHTTDIAQGIAITRINSSVEHFGLYAPITDVSPRMFSGSNAAFPVSQLGGSLDGKNHSSLNGTTIRHYKEGVQMAEILGAGGGTLFNHTLRVLTFNNAGSNILYAKVGVGWFYTGSNLEDKVATIHSILP